MVDPEPGMNFLKKTTLQRGGRLLRVESKELKVHRILL